MHAYLLTGTDKKAIELEIKNLAKGKKAKLFEFEVKKIRDVRELTRFVSLKVSETTGILIKDIDKATHEALNAFLKNLEEPQENLIFILTATSCHNLLPTVVSRCQLIKVGEEKLEDEEVAKVAHFLALSTEKKLIFTKEIRQKETALTFLEKMIISGETLIKKDPKNRVKTAKALKAAMAARKKIIANANPSLQLTNFILQIE